MPQQPNVRFFAPGQMGVRGGQPRWPQQGGRPQGQMMMPNSQFQSSRGPNPHMNFANMANMQRLGVAPMMADRLGMPPQGMSQQGMPPQGMPQVQPNYSAGMVPNLPRTPNVTQETRQVAVRSNDNIVQRDENATSDCYEHCCGCFCYSLFVGCIIFVIYWLFF